MKKFPYKFTPLIKTLFCLFFILAIGVIGFNVYKFATAEFHDNYSYATLISCLAIGALTIVIVSSMLFNSYFGINDKFLVLRWGILCNKIELSSITKLQKHEQNDKLLVYYNISDQEEFMVVFIDKLIFDDFSNQLLLKCPEISVEIVVD